MVDAAGEVVDDRRVAAEAEVVVPLADAMEVAEEAGEDLEAETVEEAVAEAGDHRVEVVGVEETEEGVVEEVV